MISLLLLILAFSTANGSPQDRQSDGLLQRPGIPSKFHVDIYSHPKTTFSCDGRQAGEYYADTEAKCAIYFICLGSVNGGLSAVSFACPNGTIFNQATRVCSPEDQVFCSLASRFYDSVNGHIDSKGKDAKEFSNSNPVHSQTWLSNQRKPHRREQDQKRPSLSSVANIQPIPLQSQPQPDTRMKQLKPISSGPRIPPPKLLISSPPIGRKVPKSAFPIPVATKKPDPRDYEEPAEEEVEYENTSSALNQ